MSRSLLAILRALFIFYCSFAVSVSAEDEGSVGTPGFRRRGYSKGDSLTVTCLNRTIETGEHISDAHGNLQYIPFPTCNETSQPLAFPYATPQTQVCTIEILPDELYHLIEFFVHSDVPLTCRVPKYPLSQAEPNGLDSSNVDEKELWTPFTIALQGTLQLSHLHLHTDINVLFHTSADLAVPPKSKDQPPSYLIGSTAYSLPNTTAGASPEGSKIIRNEPLVFTFNVGWIEGSILPGMLGRPVAGIKDHNVGFSLLSFFALAASAGVGAMLMLVYERRKSGRSMNGLLGGNTGNGGAVIGRSSGYGGYGGYSSSSSNTGKRD